MGRIATFLRLASVMAPMILSHTVANAQQPSPNGITKLSQMRPLTPKPKPNVIPKSESDVNVPPRLISNFGKTPSTLNLSGNDYVSDLVPHYAGSYSPQIEARANRMFPSISQTQEREQWMAEQEQRAIANETNRIRPLMYPMK